MAKNNSVSFQALKRQYAYLNIPEEVLLQIYEEASQNKTDSIKMAFYNLLVEYMKENMSYEIMEGYLKSIAIDPQASAVVIEKKLHSFFNFLDSVEYTLTLDDAIRLLKENSFQLLFTKKFKNKKEVSLGFYERFVEENANLELLCHLYMDEQNIEVVESKNHVEGGISSKLLSRSENIELAIKAKNGDAAAMEKILRANSGMVHKYAKYYAKFGLEYEDLIQEGMMGLMNAVSQFDPSKGCAFSTYAIWWIRQAITRAVANQARMIRIPVCVVEKLYKINKAQRELKVSLGRTPTIPEIASHLKMSSKEIQDILNNDYVVTSLQSKINGDDDSDELEHFIEDKQTNISEEAIDNYESNLLRQYLKEFLNDREFKVICYRFGIGTNTPMTLEEISKIFSVTGERIRQIEVKALRKLRNKREVQALSDENVNQFFPIKKVVETSKFETFDIHTIHPQMDLELFLRFVNFLPLRLKKAYCLYRSISFAHKTIYPKKVQDYEVSLVAIMDYVEQLLKEMYRYYVVLSKKKNLTEEERNQKLLKHMEKYSLLFRYSNYTFKEIRIAMKKLMPFEKNVLYMRYGANLHEFHDLPKGDKKSPYYYSNILSLAHADLKKFLEHPELEKKENEKKTNEVSTQRPSFVSKYPDYTIDQLKEYIQALPDKYQKIIYLRNGSNLDVVNPFPKDNKYSSYYNFYTRALQLLDNEINGIQKAPKKSTNTLLDLYSKEDLTYALSQMNPNFCEVVYLRHGKSLDKTYSFPKPPENKPNYYYNLYARIKKQVSKILEERKERIEHSFVRQLGDYSLEEVLLAVSKLDEKNRNILFLKRGENLERYLPWPDDKPLSVYNQEYNEAIFALKKVLDPAYAKRLEELEEARKQKKSIKQVKKRAPKKQTLLQMLEPEKLAEFVKLLPEKQKEAVYLRHGKELNTTLPFPKPPENRCANYYYMNYALAVKKADKINKEGAITHSKTQEKVRPGKFLEEVDHDTLVSVMEKLPDKLKEVLYLRHGKELNTTLPFPNPPENCADTYYMSLYFRAKTKVRQILNGEEEKKPKKVRVTQKSILNTFTKEELLWAVEYLTSVEKDCLYLRHSKTLDTTLPWPEENKQNYYVRYHKIVKKLHTILEQKEEFHAKEIAQEIEKLPKEAKPVKKKKKKEKKKTIETSSKRQELVDAKAKLNQIKLQNYKATLYDQYQNIYGNFVSDTDLQYIINEAMDSYSLEEGLSLELAVPKKIETNILVYLSNQYKQDPDSEKSLEILLLIEDLFGSRLKERYTHGNSCYLSDEQISRAIEETFQNYTGRLPYYVELSLKIKKTMK